jgi:hypothetical protein
MKYFKLLALLTLIVFATINCAVAQEPVQKTLPLRFLIAGALELGGDEIAEVYFTNGNTQSVKAGQGGSIAVGGQLGLTKTEKLLLRATVGIKYVTTEADNVHVRLTRVPIHVTANYMAASKLRLGAGLAMHRAIKFNADGIGENITFDGANGPIFEIAYAGIGLSYTPMKYIDNKGNTYSANAIGLTFSLTIPNKPQTTTVISPVN